MAKKGASIVSGFDFEAKGTLLTRAVSEGAAGYCHERSVSYRKSWHRHDRLNLAFPRGASVVHYKTHANLAVKIEPSQFMVMRADIDHMHWAESTVWDNFSLFPGAALVEAAGGAKLLQAGPDLVAFERSRLLNDALEKLLHDAIFRKLPDADLRPTYLFVLHLVFDEMRARRSAPRKAEEHAVRHANEAVAYVENRLFEDLDAAEIAAKMGISRASLYRNFKSYTGQSIMAYVRHRRMEEARQLIKCGGLKLGDIAQLVGYEDLYTFSAAYKAIFGFSPSKDPSVR